MIQTSKTPEGRSATCRVQGLFFSFFIFSFVFICFPFFYFFLMFCFFCLTFFSIFCFVFIFPIFSCVSFHFLFSFLLRSLHSGRSKETRVTVGRDIHQSFRVCKVDIATLKVVATIVPQGELSGRKQWHSDGAFLCNWPYDCWPY